MVTYGFYNSINHDRVYDATQMSEIFDGIIRDGVYQYVGNKFLVDKNGLEGFQIRVGTGRAWFNHTWTKNDAPLILTLPDPPTLDNYYRADAIVIDINTNINVRENKITYVKGAEVANNPSPPYPELLDGEHKQVALAYIVRRGAETEINAANINYVVGSSPCPYVTAPVQAVDLSAHVAAWEAAWNQFIVSYETAAQDFYNTKTTELTNWITRHESEFNHWSEETIAEYEAFIESQEYAFNSWKTDQEYAFNSWKTDQEDSFSVWSNLRRNQFANWMGAEEQDFNDWFDGIQTILDGDVGGHLQNEIDDIKNDTLNPLSIDKGGTGNKNGYIQTGFCPEDEQNPEEIGHVSTSEGYGTLATGMASHAEGGGTITIINNPGSLTGGTTPIKSENFINLSNKEVDIGDEYDGLGNGYSNLSLATYITSKKVDNISIKDEDQSKEMVLKGSTKTITTDDITIIESEISADPGFLMKNAWFYLIVKDSDNRIVFANIAWIGKSASALKYYAGIYDNDTTDVLSTDFTDYYTADNGIIFENDDIMITSGTEGHLAQNLVIGIRNTNNGVNSRYEIASVGAYKKDPIKDVNYIITAYSCIYNTNYNDWFPYSEFPTFVLNDDSEKFVYANKWSTGIGNINDPYYVGNLSYDHQTLEDYYTVPVSRTTGLRSLFENNKLCLYTKEDTGKILQIKYQGSGQEDIDNPSLSNYRASIGLPLYIKKLDLSDPLVYITNFKFRVLNNSTEINLVMPYDSYESRGRTVASGDYSHAEGRVTSATGKSTHSEGDSTLASGDYSHAEGLGSYASGDYSHAESTSTASGDHSHAEGGNTNAIGRSSHSEGYSTTALGNYSHAEGNGTHANGNCSHSESNQTVASGDYSHAEGYITTASGNGAHAEGLSIFGDVYSTASGDGSHVEGGGTTASGDYSHAEGYKTTASGDHSHAEGKSTVASDEYSHSEGFNSESTGSASHSEGFGTHSYGTGAHSEGGSTFASGAYAHAEGNSTRAIGNNSHAGGYLTRAYDDSQFIHGFDVNKLLPSYSSDEKLLYPSIFGIPGKPRWDNESFAEITPETYDDLQEIVNKNKGGFTIILKCGSTVNSTYYKTIMPNDIFATYLEFIELIVGDPTKQIIGSSARIIKLHPSGNSSDSKMTSLTTLYDIHNGNDSVMNAIPMPVLSSNITIGQVVYKHPIIYIRNANSDMVSPNTSNLVYIKYSLIRLM